MRRVNLSHQSASLIFCLHVLVALVVIPIPARAATLHSSAATASAENNIPSFAVATVKVNITHNGQWKMEFTHDGFTALGVPLRKLIEEAYGIYEDERILGESHKLDDQLYDIKAKVDDIDVARFLDLERDQRKILLQRLLAERFGLKLHSEDKMQPIYRLVIAKNGPRFKIAAADLLPYKGVDPVPTVKRIRRGHLEIEQFSFNDFARLLTQLVQRQVVDGTSIPGRYDLTLDWNPDDGRATVPNTSSAPDELKDISAPSLFTAVQEQLGLQLIPAKGPIKVIVVDEVSSATSN